MTGGTHALEPDRPDLLRSPKTRAVVEGDVPGFAGRVDRLQRTAGNRAVAGLLQMRQTTVQRHPDPTLELVPAPLDLTDETEPATGTDTTGSTTGTGTTGSTGTPTTGTTPTTDTSTTATDTLSTSTTTTTATTATTDTPTTGAPETGTTATTGTPTTGTATTTAVATTAPAATTLTAAGPMAAYAGAAEALRTGWATHSTADARAMVLGQAAAAQLTAVGVHAPTTVVADLPAGNGGNFAFATWSLTLARLPFSGTAANAAAINGAIEATFHEARHCEQWFRMARLRAGQGQTSAQIAKEMGIAPAAAAAAHAVPIATGTAEAAQAMVWWEGIYGAGKADRNEVLKEVMAALTALNTAKRADAAGSTTETAAALAKARRRYRRAHVEYRALPEEADAFGTETGLRAALADARSLGTPATTGDTGTGGTPP